MTASRPAGWVRGAGLVLLAVVLFWLPVEDTSARAPLLLAAAGAVLGFFSTPSLRPDADPCLAGVGRLLLTGALAGFGVAPAAALLMVFKSGLHSHGFPDFTIGQLLAVLQLAPFISLAGGLAGAGAGYWHRRRCRPG